MLQPTPDEDPETFRTDKQLPIRLRVVNVLKVRWDGVAALVGAGRCCARTAGHWWEAKAHGVALVWCGCDGWNRGGGGVCMTVVCK